jgi:hypothetical protein
MIAAFMLLNDLPQSSPQVFYSLAATLIPIFLFGGATVAHLSRPPRGTSQMSLAVRAWLIAFFCGVAIIAEASAILAALAGEAGDVQRGFIVMTLIAGMVVTAAGIWLPWVARVGRTNLPKGLKTLTTVVPGLFLLVSAVPVISLMNDALRVARESEKISALSVAVRHHMGEVRDSERRIDAYRYRLGRLKERRALAIERDEPLVHKVVVLEIEAQEEFKSLQEGRLQDLLRTATEEVIEAKPEF